MVNVPKTKVVFLQLSEADPIKSTDTFAGVLYLMLYLLTATTFQGTGVRALSKWRVNRSVSAGRYNKSRQGRNETNET